MRTEPPPAPCLPLAAKRLAVVALLALSPGCRPAEEIRTYRIAKPADSASSAATPVDRSASAAPAADRGEPTDRMLAMILPAADRAWFFKAVGLREAIEPVAESVRSFFASVRMADGKPEWETPEGWSERPASSMRLATLVIPSENAADIEMSVIGLPKVGDWQAQLLDNANRWRGQLGLDPLEAGELADAIESVEGASDGAALMDAAGWFEGGAMPPLARAAGGPAKPPTPAPSAPSELKYETPDGWTDKPGSAMRKASFSTAGGSEVTAFAFPNVAAMADPLGNVNRWRGQIELPPITAEALAAETEAMALLGEEGKYFEFVGPTKTTYVAMATVEDRVWFFKLNGANGAAAADREAFRGWLVSLSLR